MTIVNDFVKDLIKKISIISPIGSKGNDYCWPIDFTDIGGHVSFRAKGDVTTKIDGINGHLQVMVVALS